MNKQDRVGVTIITPAFCRVAGLKRAIESVDEQTYQDWQHLIVHDGPAPLDLYEMVIGHSDTRRKLIELGQDTLVSGLCQMKGNGPALAGWLFAAHPIVTYCMDDDYLYEDHVSVLLALLSQPAVDVAYSSRDHFDNGVFSGRYGRFPPLPGGIGLCDVMHRLTLVRESGWHLGSVRNDWDMFETWLKLGKRFAFSPKATHAFCH